MPTWWQCNERRAICRLPSYLPVFFLPPWVSGCRFPSFPAWERLKSSRCAHLRVSLYGHIASVWQRLSAPCICVHQFRVWIMIWFRRWFSLRLDISLNLSQFHSSRCVSQQCVINSYLSFYSHYLDCRRQITHALLCKLLWHLHNTDFTIKWCDISASFSHVF